MSEPVFLSLEEVFALHADQVQRYRGATGIRDMKLLQFALAAPETSYAGEFLHTNIHEMAAAYLFHLVSNHPFVDGNKRTGLMTALIFLGLNGYQLQAKPNELYQLVMGVADSSVSKSQVAVFFEENTHRRVG